MSSYQQRLLRLLVIGLQIVAGGHCVAQRSESDLSGAGWRMNIVPELNKRDGPANVARRLFLNFCH